LALVAQQSVTKIKSLTIVNLFTTKAVACPINIYDRKFYDRKLRLSLERNYDRTIVILAMAS
jgi:hypothetical protein